MKLIFERWNKFLKEALEDLQPQDEVDVYHGTRLAHIFDLINGFDANKTVYRHYGGPKHAGLFVTPSLDTALRFSDRGEIVIQMKIQAKNLHGTDWSGKLGTKDNDEDWKWKYPDSFRPYLSSTMQQSGEPQALLRGLVKPGQIKQVWYQPFQKEGKWYSREEFLNLGLEAVPAADQPYGRPKKIEDIGWDMSYPNYSLEQFLAALAEAIDVPSEKVDSVMRRYWEMNYADGIEEILDDAGFGPTAIQGFLRQMALNWEPNNDGEPVL
mgnify:FL=1